MVSFIIFLWTNGVYQLSSGPCRLGPGRRDGWDVNKCKLTKGKEQYLVCHGWAEGGGELVVVVEGGGGRGALFVLKH